MTSHAERLRPAPITRTAAYVTVAGNAFDVRAWSGLPYFMARALGRQSIAFDSIGPLETRCETLFKMKEGVYRYALRRRHPRDREPYVAKHYSRQVIERLAPHHEFVFSPGTTPISYLDCEQPIVVWTDATFAALVDFYPMYTNVSRETLRDGHMLESAALQRCRLAIYSSEWAAASAVAHYGMRPDQVAVVPFGANMTTSLSEGEINEVVAARSTEVCRLLFIGVEWKRKGGARAIEVAAELNAAGTPTHLDIVGSRPDGGTPPDFVTLHGFVDKSSPAGRDKLMDLLLRAHFLVLPARAECFGVVLCEAAAHGVPVLATSVGGIPTIVRADVNGKTFAPGAEASEYAEYVTDVFAARERYHELARSSFAEYRRRLNWDVAGAKVRNLIDLVLFT